MRHNFILSMQFRNSLSLGFIGFFAGFLVACQTLPVRREFSEIPPTQLVKSACAVGASIQVARGGAGFSVKTKEFTGQFKAQISATHGGDTVVEVQNPLGGTEMIAKGRGNEFSLEFPKEPIRNQTGRPDWAGVPVRHLRKLFLGQVPCPEGVLSEFGDAVVDSNGEVFLFTYRSEDKQPWPESLEWKPTQTSPYSVRFDFDKPEGDDLVPRQWQARSGESEIVVKWRTRTLTRSGSVQPTP